MSTTIDPATRRIVLDSATVTAKSIYAAWVDWAALDDNAKYLPAFRSVGGDDLGDGLFIPPYYFLANGWRVRPMEADQTLTITGNLFVEGGGDPVVKTLGVFAVLVKMVVPVQAQGISVSGGGTAPTVNQVAAQIRVELASELERITQLAALHAIGATLTVTPSTRTAGSIVQRISTNGDTTIVTPI